MIIDRNTIILLRFPFSYYLMPIYLFAVSQSTSIDWNAAILIFIILHLFIYPASNGYNSYMDQDETSIGGIKHPPKPTKKLFYASIMFDLIGLVLSLFIGLSYMCYVFIYLLASRAYSYKKIRLKKYPFLGFLTVVFFQGAFTYWMVLTGVSGQSIVWTIPLFYILIGCSFLIGGVYPLTQIYQHQADKANGDITISYRLGVRGTFIFCSLMFAISTCFMFFYFSETRQLNHFYIFHLFLIPVIIRFIFWLFKTWKNFEEASFENAMSMNLIASTSMNLLFLFLIFLNHFI